jgi:hypothetical protein
VLLKLSLGHSHVNLASTNLASVNLASANLACLCVAQIKP